MRISPSNIDCQSRQTDLLAGYLVVDTIANLVRQISSQNISSLTPFFAAAGKLDREMGKKAATSPKAGAKPKPRGRGGAKAGDHAGAQSVGAMLAKGAEKPVAAEAAKALLPLRRFLPCAAVFERGQPWFETRTLLPPWLGNVQTASGGCLRGSACCLLQSA